MVCSTEKCGGVIFARGLCQKCYTRNRRTGSVSRVNAQNIGACCVDECEKPAFAKGMCAHHYEKSRHPMNHAWRLLRTRNRGEYPPEWDSFAFFLADVGDRPTHQHQLRRVVAAEPFSKTNFKWLAPAIVGRDSMSKEERKAYSRRHHLLKKYGLTPEDYNRMLEAQGGVCAICGKTETFRYESGKLKELAVDHCHKTKINRGLLCYNHNEGIGKFQDDPNLLRKAADYLDRHSA